MLVVVPGCHDLATAHMHAATWTHRQVQSDARHARLQHFTQDLHALRRRPDGGDDCADVNRTRVWLLRHGRRRPLDIHTSHLGCFAAWGRGAPLSAKRQVVQSAVCMPLRCNVAVHASSGAPRAPRSLVRGRRQAGRPDHLMMKLREAHLLRQSTIRPRWFQSPEAWTCRIVATPASWPDCPCWVPPWCRAGSLHPKKFVDASPIGSFLQFTTRPIALLGQERLSSFDATGRCTCTCGRSSGGLQMLSAS